MSKIFRFTSALYISLAIPLGAYAAEAEVIATSAETMAANSAGDAGHSGNPAWIYFSANLACWFG